jgi:nickel-dependent lactate racemase
MYKTQVEKRADIIFISPGGSPLDANIFDSYGCLENALKILRGRGMITLVAECFEGYGNMEFYETISRFKNDLGSLEKSLKRRFSIGGFLAYRFLRALKRAEISMVSVIPDYYASEIPGLRMFRIANEALNYALKEYGRKAKVSVIPHGNHIIPVLKEAENNP